MRSRIDSAAIDWRVALFLVGYQAALVVGLPFYFLYNTPAAGVVAASIGLLLLTQIGIGAAYHRYYAHRCYSLHPAAEVALLFLASLALQGTALRWSHDHRKHHAFVDTDDDPYSIKKGFFFAHVGWLFFKSEPIDERRVRDLLRNPFVTFQHRHALLTSFGGNAAVTALVGWATGDWLGAFVLAWWTRLAVSHHLTWFVNSLAHTWGSRSYSREHSAVDNFLVAIVTVGEGYHNYHHTFASDYRNGVRWYHFDPTKWTIWTLSRLGLASNLRRFSRAMIERRLLAEDRRRLLEAVARHSAATRAELERRITGLADALHANLRRIAEARDELRRLGRDRAAKEPRRTLREELRTLRRAARRDARDWARLCRRVLSTETAAANA